MARMRKQPIFSPMLFSGCLRSNHQSLRVSHGRHLRPYCHAGGYLGRYVVVVDDDIDVTNTNDVLWALTTRSNPEIDIETIRRSWSGPLDPIIPKGQKGHSSRAIIDACRPYEWMSEFPPVAESSPEVRRAAEEKWGKILDE